MTVGALVLFGVARVVAAALSAHRGWRIASVTQWFFGAALVFFFYAPQLLDMLFTVDSHMAFVELQGKIVGGALALFCAPIVSHRLGYE